MTKPLRVAITSGDLDGIGLEVTSKALYRLKPQRGVQFFLWRSHQASDRDLNRIGRSFKRVVVPDWHSALKVQHDYYKTIVEIDSPLAPAKWVETMAKAGNSKAIDALVTAPLSKTGIIQAGMKDNGHTDILKRITKTKNVFMTFLGKEFNVVLLTGHTSIKKAYDQINGELLESCLLLTDKMRSKLPSRQKDRPIAVVGLSPHAGEEGVIDSKELDIFKPVIKKLKARKLKLSDPLVPDVCFQKNYWKNYSFYLASYHDQGLIPFKMVHGANSGVQISLGLPFLRTSVDHGTAKDIFGKNKAQSGSMESAIKVALKILKDKPITW